MAWSSRNLSLLFEDRFRYRDGRYDGETTTLVLHCTRAHTCEKYPFAFFVSKPFFCFLEPFFCFLEPESRWLWQFNKFDKIRLLFNALHGAVKRRRNVMTQNTESRTKSIWSTFCLSQAAAAAREPCRVRNKKAFDSSGILTPFKLISFRVSAYTRDLYPWYILVPWDIPVISLVVAGYITDIPNTCSRTIDMLFLGYPISGLSRSGISMVYLAAQHGRLGYPNPDLHRFCTESADSRYPKYIFVLMRKVWNNYGASLQTLISSISGHFAAFCAMWRLRVSTACRRLSVWSSVWPSSVCATESPPRQGSPLPNCQIGPTWWPAVRGSHDKWS